jgi:hypothetical protein
LDHRHRGPALDAGPRQELEHPAVEQQQLVQWMLAALREQGSRGVGRLLMQALRVRTQNIDIDAPTTQQLESACEQGVNLRLARELSRWFVAAQIGPVVEIASPVARARDGTTGC